MTELTHIDEAGRVRMVDVSGKAPSLRRAIAGGTIRMRPETLAMIRDGSAQKGNVLETARIAGVMAAKKTAELIPLCHPLNLSHASVDFEFQPAPHPLIEIRAEVATQGPTGVEMEAITAVGVAAITIYDMCKAADKQMIISDIRLVEKSGGQSGFFQAPPTG